MIYYGFDHIDSVDHLKYLIEIKSNGLLGSEPFAFVGDSKFEYEIIDWFKQQGVDYLVRIRENYLYYNYDSVKMRELDLMRTTSIGLVSNFRILIDLKNQPNFFDLLRQYRLKYQLKDGK